MNITRQEFENYIAVRDSGQYNMVMDALPAAAAANLDIHTYFEIIKNFKTLLVFFKNNPQANITVQYES